MGCQEMVQHVQERQNVRLVLALLRVANVINDHVSYFFYAVLLLQKILSKRSGGDFRQMLMLRDCENLLLGQPA